MKIKLENQKLIQDQTKKKSWNKEGGWVHEEGKRAELTPVFENFYRSIKDGLKNKDVLDIGCGEGKFLIPMLQDGLNVTGTDISDVRLKNSEKNIKRAGKSINGKVKLMEGESKKLDFPDESFDYIFAKGSIHHNTWEGVRQSFREVKRVLKSGQFFLFQARSTSDAGIKDGTPIFFSPFGVTVKGPKFGEDGVIQHYFTKEALENLAKENGFEIVVEPEEILRRKEGSEKINARWWVVYRKQETR